MENVLFHVKHLVPTLEGSLKLELVLCFCQFHPEPSPPPRDKPPGHDSKGAKPSPRTIIVYNPPVTKQSQKPHPHKFRKFHKCI